MLSLKPVGEGTFLASSQLLVIFGIPWLEDATSDSLSYLCVCVCVQTSLFHKDTSLIGLEPTLITFF